MTRKRTGASRATQSRTTAARSRKRERRGAVRRQTQAQTYSETSLHPQSSIAAVARRTRDVDSVRQDNAEKRCSPDLIHRVFTSGFTGITLQTMNVLQEGDASNIRGMSQRFVEDFENRMNATDPLERLLIEQILMTQHRSFILSTKAAAAVMNAHAGTASIAASLNQQCDQAANTLRRLILALADYRYPRRALPQNVNSAQQQIVNQHFLTDRKD
jgi:hypothetical protein